MILKLIVLSEWESLKIHITTHTIALTNINYFDIWANVFKCDEMKVACGNVLHIIEILLTTSFTNTKVKRFVSRMNRIERHKESIESRKTGKSVASG